MSNTKECPYNLNIEQASQTMNEYNGDNQITLTTFKLIENQNPMPCRKSKCGAYRFGHCTRKS